MRRRAIVSGAGVAGLAAAVLLARRGWEVAVHEAAEAPGGLLRPFAFRGLACDLGSHRLHPGALAEPLLAELAATARLTLRPRRGCIVLAGRHLPYPLTIPGLCWGLGLTRGAAFCRDLARAGGMQAWAPTRQATEDVGFEAFVRARAGHAAYEAFYRPYAEKVWGLPPADLSQTVARQRVSSDRPWQQVAAALRPGRVQFLYPQAGMAAVAEALMASARAAGVTLDFGRALPPADTLDADAVLHSGRLADLAPDTDLQHRGLYLVFLALPTARLHPVETWYTPESRYWFGRVAEVGNYSESLRNPGETALCLEIPEGRWGRGVDFTAQTAALLEQLDHARIVPRGMRPVAVAQTFVPGVYPLYRRGWRGPWQAALRAVTSSGRVLPIGRQGLFLHCNIDHAMAIARAATEHLEHAGTGHGWVEKALMFQGLQVRD